MKIRKELWFGFSLMAVIIATILFFTPWGALTNGHLGLLMLALVVVTIMLGFPTAFTLMGMGVFFAWLAYRSVNPDLAVRQVLDLMVQRTYAVMANDVLIAVPLFVFMGYLALERTRTSTMLLAATSRQCVYQFRHERIQARGVTRAAPNEQGPGATPGLEDQFRACGLVARDFGDRQCGLGVAAGIGADPDVIKARLRAIDAHAGVKAVEAAVILAEPLATGRANHERGVGLRVDRNDQRTVGVAGLPNQVKIRRVGDETWAGIAELRLGVDFTARRQVDIVRIGSEASRELDVSVGGLGLPVLGGGRASAQHNRGGREGGGDTRFRVHRLPRL